MMLEVLQRRDAMAALEQKAAEADELKATNANLEMLKRQVEEALGVAQNTIIDLEAELSKKGYRNE